MEFIVCARLLAGCRYNSNQTGKLANYRGGSERGASERRKERSRVAALAQHRTAYRPRQNQYFRLLLLLLPTCPDSAATTAAAERLGRKTEQKSTERDPNNKPACMPFHRFLGILQASRPLPFALLFFF